jgi:flagellar hook-associated protein 3 FlgL
MTGIRVTEQYRQASQQRYLLNAEARMDQVQRQLATNRKIERASDDPAGTALSMRHRKDIAFEAQMRRNLDNGSAFLAASEAALDSGTESLQRLRELTVQAANDTLSQQQRAGIAQEVDQLTQQLLQVGNTNFGGAYIFGGHQTKTPPYLVAGSPPTTVTYQGDAGQRLHQISEQDTVAVNVVGSTAFGNMFTDLIALRDNISQGTNTQLIRNGIADIDSALDRVMQARADVGARINRFDAAKNQSEQTDVNLQDLRSKIEDVDLTEAIVQLNAQKNALDAAMGAIGRTADMSLMNFLR